MGLLGDGAIVVHLCGMHSICAEPECDAGIKDHRQREAYSALRYREGALTARPHPVKLPICERK